MFNYEIWLDGNLLTESDCGFDSDQEAMENGIEDTINHIYALKAGGIWKGETVEDFQIKVIGESLPKRR